MQQVDIDGVFLEVHHIPVAAGTQPGGAPLVFLHEGLGSVAMWRDWPASLCAATGRAGWVYSRQGYGRSSPVPDVRGEPREHPDGTRSGRLQPDYMHREALEVLPRLLARLGIERPVLVGHSDGGTIALIHAAAHPVTACVVMAPHVMVEDISVQSIDEARRAFETTDLPDRLARYHDDVQVAFWQWNDVWLSPAFRDFDIRGEIGGISAPLLAIQGLDDQYGTLAQIEDVARAVPHAQLLAGGLRPFAAPRPAGAGQRGDHALSGPAGRCLKPDSAPRGMVWSGPCPPTPVGAGLPAMRRPCCKQAGIGPNTPLIPVRQRLSIKRQNNILPTTTASTG
ncbi:alpha/beta fold hydrolase [Ottowia beijingensis]|uniref:alpha/beta fold hydrolase n=1 Tax=Ottowia beijingensis TaxID=1207057 RepID=UPI0027D9E8BB|nr:alpha/beta fold hydrolase [Ottowia beijingensis]